MNNLVKLTKLNQNNTTENLIENGQVMNEKRITNNRKLNCIDFYYILCRIMKSSIMREWDLLLLKVLCLFWIELFIIAIYPNDIGSDPLCPIDLSNEVNITQITELVFDTLNGKRSKGEFNVSYLMVLIYYFGIIYYFALEIFVSNDIQVSNYQMNKMNFIQLILFRYSSLNTVIICIPPAVIIWRKISLNYSLV